MGATALFSLFKQKTRDDGMLGIEASDSGVAFAHIVRAADQLPTLKQCEFLPVEKGAADSRIELLQGRIAALGLQHLPCNIVLPVGSYSLLLVEAPRVPKEELRDALRWRVKDLISFPIDEAAIDVFLLPEDSSRGGNPMAYVVAVKKSLVQETVELADKAKLSLQSIDISELSLRNLSSQCCDSQRGIALVKLSQGAGSLHLMRGGNLYLSRQFDLDYNAGLLDDLPEETLILELQRSLDYYERQMRQAPPAQIFFCGENVTEDKITAVIRDSLPGEISILPLRQALSLGEGVEEHLLPLCMGAIGGALREQEVTT